MIGAWILPVAIGLGAGILSGMGVGGGTLLLVYLTTVLQLPQATAQGLNLLFFLPAGSLALISHMKHGLVVKSVALPAICTGLLFSGLSAWIATGLDTDLLRRIFGAFLIFIALRELFRKPTKKAQP